MLMSSSDYINPVSLINACIQIRVSIVFWFANFLQPISFTIPPAASLNYGRQRRDLENCTMERRKIKMILHDDLIYQILLWLPVISLLRFKNACKSWLALIESGDFIKQHLHRHHYDPSLKDKNHNLIYPLLGDGVPLTFSLTSIGSFEESNVCLQLNRSDLHEYSSVRVLDMVSYCGIICLNLFNGRKKHTICLWNPATKQFRVLPQSPALRLETKYDCLITTVGFGFDVKNNDYKVVNLCENSRPGQKGVEVYSLNSGSWRSISTIFLCTSFVGNPGMPFNSGTCFFWNAFISKNKSILCFDFSSENFRFVSFPDADYIESGLFASVVNDKIACVSKTNDYQIEILMFNDYGSVNESWVKLYTIDPYSTINRRMSVNWISMNGNYLFFGGIGPLIRYNVVTKEIKNLPMDCGLPNIVLSYYRSWVLVEFKESLLSVGKESNENA